MLTEEKAKRLHCCGPRGTWSASLENRCIASDCMAWRWVMISQSARGAIIGGNGDLEWDGRPPIGYCGLAGSAVGR